jgi:hypothetical protein
METVRRAWGRERYRGKERERERERERGRERGIIYIGKENLSNYTWRG